MKQRGGWGVGTPGTDQGDYLGFVSATLTADSAIRIGTLATDAEAASPANSTATGDVTTGADEDLNMPAFTVGTATTLTVPMTITAALLSGSTARVNVFVVWNGDNDVIDPNETPAVQTVSASGSFVFTLLLPPRRARNSSASVRRKGPLILASAACLR